MLALEHERRQAEAVDIGAVPHAQAGDVRHVVEAPVEVREEAPLMRGDVVETDPLQRRRGGRQRHRPDDVRTPRLEPVRWRRPLDVGETQPVVCEVFAQRYGSPLDALLSISDEKGNILQRNDDAMGADARIEMKFDKDKDYIVSVTDLLGRGGSNYPYRLQITPVAPEQPDFEVVFLPELPRVARGGRPLLQRQPYRERASAALLASHGDGATVLFDDLARHR